MNSKYARYVVTLYVRDVMSKDELDKDISYYKLELAKAKEKYNAALKSDSCKAIMDSYHEIQKIKKTIQLIRESENNS